MERRSMRLPGGARRSTDSRSGGHATLLLRRLMASTLTQPLSAAATRIHRSSDRFNDAAQGRLNWNRRPQWAHRSWRNADCSSDRSAKLDFRGEGERSRRRKNRPCPVPRQPTEWSLDQSFLVCFRWQVVSNNTNKTNLFTRYWSHRFAVMSFSRFIRVHRKGTRHFMQMWSRQFKNRIL